MIPDTRTQPEFGTTLLLATWLSGVAAAALVTGALASPLMILFAGAPLAAWAFGLRERLPETIAFSVLAVAIVGLIDAFGAAPGSIVSTAERGWLGAASALAMAAFGIWAAARSGAFKGGDAAPEPAVPEMARSVASLELPMDGPAALLDVTPLGRIRAVSGARGLVRGLDAGGSALDALSAATGRDLSRLLDGSSKQTLALRTGASLLVHVAPNVNGARLFVVRTDPSAPDERPEIDAALQRQSAFYAGFAHDLKSPLNAILGFADIMRAELRGPIPAPYADYPDLIHESGRDLLLLVDDLMDLAKAKSKRHRLEFEPVDLVASGRSVRRQMEGVAARAGVELSESGEREAWVTADARAVRQIWQNLLSNAIKYSERGGRVVLHTTVGPTSASLAVSDEGGGMTREDLERIGEPFEQGENAAGRAGTGLGLAVVKTFADLQKGEVVIETAPGQGTRVTVTLPLADPADVAVIGDAAQ